MKFKSNLVKFTVLLILSSLFGAACSQATPEEFEDIVIGPEEFGRGQEVDATQQRGVCGRPHGRGCSVVSRQSVAIRDLASGQVVPEHVVVKAAAGRVYVHGQNPRQPKADRHQEQSDHRR